MKPCGALPTKRLAPQLPSQITRTSRQEGMTPLDVVVSGPSHHGSCTTRCSVLTRDDTTTCAAMSMIPDATAAKPGRFAQDFRLVCRSRAEHMFSAYVRIVNPPDRNLCQPVPDLPARGSADIIRGGTIVPFMASGSLRDGRRRPSRKATPTGPHATDPLAWSALNRLAPIYV